MDFDLFVMGGGSGGVRAARIAAQHGARVALAEASALGGTCVNLGCVPKKLFAYAADMSTEFAAAPGFGWAVTKCPAFDWPTLRDNKDAEIARLNGLYRKGLESAGVQIVKGFARFAGPHAIEVGGKTHTAQNIIIATGGYPRRLGIPGGEHAKTSDDMFHLDVLPQTALILGGGYIAVEFAHILSGLGVKVDLMYRRSLFLRGFDDDIRSALAEEMAQQGITLHFGRNITEISKTSDAYRVLDTQGDERDYGVVLAAIGRDAALDIGLENAGLSVNAKRMLDVDDHYRTPQKHIFAVGDISSRYALTPVAIREGHAVADFLFAPGNPTPSVNYENLATAVFSAPPIGTAGLTEEQARAQGLDIAIYKTRFRPMKNTLSGAPERTLMKLIVDRATDRVVGIHMLGADAPEMLQCLAVALTAGATKGDFDRTMAVHPTAAEEWVTLRTSA
ncbi:MAG TPA: glutathione-disulfide reductase [Rhodospirillaceae bacterium]|jgi:glutathione reductase (NADPH)|nr:glutathione-disulfide reductase [Alphaproteobacteria bacterium]HBH25811.1 glutathione-disulfide reductase [Rhodospirillaceae bacterium]